MSDDLAMVGNLDDVLKLSNTLAKAIGTGFVPKAYRTAAEIAAVILAGRELGVPPMASLRNFFLIEGKLGMDASFVLGRMKQAGIAHEWLVDTNECATLVLTRHGDKPYTSTFSMDDAKRANLAGKAIWKSYPRAMLKARAVTAGARAYAPDVFSGAVYTAEELRGGDEPAEQAPSLRIDMTPVGEVVDEAVAKLTSSVDTLAPVKAFEAAQTVEEIEAIYKLLRPTWGALTNDQKRMLQAQRVENTARVHYAVAALAEAMRTDDDGGYIGGEEEQAP